MQFPYSWLKELVPSQLNPDSLAHVLTMSGLEVEEIETAAPAFSGVVIAEVKSVEKHPNADRLNIAQVDVGQENLLQIVCGAPNVRAGIKVPCALNGALLPNDFAIKPTKMRGVLSNGMLCSARELGLPEKIDGLLELPENAPVGVLLRDFLNLDDTLLTLKITPNRADCLSLKGIAREVAALTQSSVSFPVIPKIETSIDDIQAVKIESPRDCARFLTRVIQGVQAQAKSPDWLVEKLARCGLRSVSALVDIGNYVMLELGQPMHVFDADKLSGSLIIRHAKNGETLACLNDKTVTLSDNTLVVADEEKVLSIAGLMGGAESAVSDETRNIVLESAWFHPEIISGKSRQYGFGSDSSFRYERGVDFTLQRDAIERATQLILEICSGKAGKITETLGTLPENKHILLRTKRVEKVLGVGIEQDTIHTILNDLGLQPTAHPEGWLVSSPSFRFDIEREEDLIEEVARVYGYDNIPDEYTSGQLSILPQPETRQARANIYRQLALRGFQEIVSYAFVDESWEKDFANNQNPIRLQNPLAAQYAVMRSTLIGSLVEVLQNNLNRKHNRVRLFEIARTFVRENNQFTQQERIGGLVYGSVQPEQWGEKTRAVDFYDLKADVESLLVGKQVQFAKTEHPALHPGRAAQISVDGKNIGFMGELHPQWLQKYDLPQAALVFELDLNAVLNTQKVRYQSVSKFQAVRRDLAFVLPEKVIFDDLLRALQSVSSDLIQEIRLFDVYRGAGLPENMKSMALKVILQDMNNTLTDEMVEPVIAQLIAAAEQVGAKLR